jgi:two-component system CheB/CheR fusion protein
MHEESNSDADPFFYVVGIGASAGGLEALERFFQSTPPDTGMAFIVVQHLSPDFKSLMGEVRSRWTDMPIRTAVNQMPIAPNTVFLMPSNTELIISNGKLLLTARERTEELRLPIDQFLRSLARDWGPRSVGIILSGTGSDGSRGSQGYSSGRWMRPGSKPLNNFRVPHSREERFVNVIVTPFQLHAGLLDTL